MLIIAAVPGVRQTCASAAGNDAAIGPNLSLPLVFDPLYKKYFIGGDAKFMLKQGEASSIIDLIEVSVDGGDFKPYLDAIQFRTEGKHTFKFRAKNPINNWSPVQFTEVFVDLAAPVTEAKWPDSRAFKEGGDLFFSPSTPLTLVAQDNLSGVGRIEYSWNGENFVPFIKAVTVDKTGKQTLYYRSIDKVGNVEPVRRLDFFGDATPPVSTMDLNGTAKQVVMEGKEYLGSSDATGFELKATDTHSKVKQIWISIDGKTPVPYLRPIFFLKDGPHILKYLAEDNVGNKEEPKTVAIWTVSQAPKTTAIPIGKIINTGGMNFAGRDFTLKLDAKDNVVGLDHIEYKINEEPDFRTYVEPLRFNRTGLYTVSYRSLDRAGNTEPTRVYTVLVQYSPPETIFATSMPLTQKDGVAYSPSPNVVTFTVTNSSVGVDRTYYSFNDGTMKQYTGPITITATSKINKISYRSIDRLGNEEPLKSIVLHMITTSPVVDLFVSDGKSVEERIRTNFFENPNAGKALKSAARTTTVEDAEPEAPEKQDKLETASEVEEEKPVKRAAAVKKETKADRKPAKSEKKGKWADLLKKKKKKK